VRTEGWRYPITPRPWSELHAFYEKLADTYPEFTYLRLIVESVEKSGRTDALGAITSMHDLVVVDTPVAEPPIEVIIVRAPGSLHPPRAGNVRIEHRSHTGRNNEIERPEADAVRLFWRFVNEKWGVQPDVAEGTESA